MHALVLDVGDRDRDEQDEQREVPDPRLVPARGSRRRGWGRAWVERGLRMKISK